MDSLAIEKTVPVSAGPGFPAHRTYGPDEHGIIPTLLGSEALTVHRTLRNAGYEAYLVGGCVRDALLGREPKDFDVSTNALPDEVHKLFSRSRVVGRRFQIVHVRCGRETIEVSTFRGHHSPDFGSEPEDEATPRPNAVRTESGMLLRDNVFGTVEEDARRRDFTVNGLYYDPDANVVMDFSTGMEDLEARLLRVIGDPAKRYREDPVRMLRAVRFAAKLNFSIERGAASSIDACHEMLSQVAPARLFDEILKLLLAGMGEATFVLLERHRLFAELFPGTAQAVAELPAARALLLQALRNSDERIAQGKAVTPAFLYAAMLWPALCRRTKKLQRGADVSEFAAMQEAIPDVIRQQAQRSTIPRRFATPMREIWEMQHRLISRRQAQRVAAHPRFRAAYDFILLREQAGESLSGCGEWWTQFQHGDMPVVVAESAPSARRKRRRGRRSSRAEPG